VKKCLSFPFLNVHSSTLSLLHLNYAHGYQSVLDFSTSVKDENKTINLNPDIFLMHLFALCNQNLPFCQGVGFSLAFHSV
jgi:hypothetical protein